MSDRSQDETQQFLQAMEKLARAPDKDREGTGAPRGAGRVRRRKRPLVVEERLDLHGLSATAAREALQAFVAGAHRKGARRVLVITGKGRGSVGGVGVLPKVVSQWATGPGRPLVAEIRAAPEALGGRGAQVLELKR